MRESVRKLLYVYMNGKIRRDRDLKYEDVVEELLDADEARAILASIEGTSTEYEPLPDGDDSMEDSGTYEEDEDEDEEDEDDGDADRFGAVWEIPEGFEYMTKPDELLKGTRSRGTLQGLYVAQLFQVSIGQEESWRWFIGKVTRYRGVRSTYNYDVVWEDGQHWVKLDLANYKDAPSDDEQELEFVEGDTPQHNWAFLTKPDSNVIAKVEREQR